MSSHAEWPPSPAELVLEPEEVQLFLAELTCPVAALAAHAALLSADEQERALRFHFDVDRVRYVVGRSTLRKLLGQLSRTDPAKLRFRYGERGKPALLDDPRWRFNVSHSRDRMLVAIAHEREVGVDLEWEDPKAEVERIAQHFFAAGERSAMTSLPEAERRAAFFRCWARKEAYLKLRGVGLALPLDRFEVSIVDAPQVTLSSAEDPREAAAVLLRTVDVGPGYAAALATEAGPLRFQRWRV